MCLGKNWIFEFLGKITESLSPEEAERVWFLNGTCRFFQGKPAPKDFSSVRIQESPAPSRSEMKLVGCNVSLSLGNVGLWNPETHLCKFNLLPRQVSVLRCLSLWGDWRSCVVIQMWGPWGDSMCAVGVEGQGENLKKRSPHEARTMSGVRWKVLRVYYGTWILARSLVRTFPWVSLSVKWDFIIKPCLPPRQWINGRA